MGIAQTNGTTLWLSESDLGNAGYRQTTIGGRRVGQFAMCWRDGAWVYPEYRNPDESANAVAERAARDRARCKTEDQPAWKRGA